MMIENDHSMAEIARYMDKDKSVICREIKRNRDQRSGKYTFELAERKCRARHARKGKHVHFTGEIRVSVEKEIRKKLSPEQVVGRFRLEGVPCVSHETIYRHIWQDKARGGNLHIHLRNKGKHYRKRGDARDKRGVIPNRTDIDARPRIVEERSRFGDFEADTIIGKAHKGAILTLTDRAIGYGMLRKLDGKEAGSTTEKMIRALKPFKRYLHTITSDNGLEFAGHEQIAKETDTSFYFAKPYHSWERGSNENYNRLVRQYFPKKTNLRKISFAEIRKVQECLNDRPRKRLNFLTPNEVVKSLNIFRNIAVAFIS